MLFVRVCVHLLMPAIQDTHCNPVPRTCSERTEPARLLLGLNPSYDIYWPCDLGQVYDPFWKVPYLENRSSNNTALRLLGVQISSHI